MTYEAPADTALYEIDAMKAARLLARNGDYESAPSWPGAAVFRPRCLRQFNTRREPGINRRSLHTVNRLRERVTLYVHGMRRPSGEARLVVVNGPAEGNLYTLTSELDCSVYQPAGVTSQPHQVNEIRLFNYGGSYVPAQLSVARSDPADLSHFTIRYTSQGQTGIIDGWLEDDDNVHFAVRSGPARGF